MYAAIVRNDAMGAGRARPASPSWRSAMACAAPAHESRERRSRRSRANDRQRRVTPLIGRDRHARFRPPPAALRRRTAPLHAHRRPRPHALVQPGGHRAHRHDARGGRPPAARGRAGHRQDHARPRAGPRDPGSRRAHPVHPRHAPLRHHGHLGLRSAGEGVHVLSRPPVRADRSCRRDTDPRRRQLPPARYAKRPWIQALASRASGARGTATGPRTRRQPPR